MASCDNCKFVRDRERFMMPVPEGQPVQVNQGFCHRGPPKVMSQTSSQFAPINLHHWCGEHRWSLRGFLRAIGRLFGIDRPTR